MSEVKRYDVKYVGESDFRAAVVDEDGPLVSYLDYSVLKAECENWSNQCAALIKERDMYRNAEMSWEKTMMSAIGEDGTGSVTKAISDLKAERDELAAENAALKAAIAKYAKVKQDFDDFDGDRRGIAACLCEAEDALVDGIKIPATDAYANQLRAEGVEMFAAHLRTDKTEASVCKMIALGADEFAANLRKENGDD